MTQPIAVTPEMRKAVYEADCEEQGHIFDYDNLVQGRDGGSGRILDLVGRDDKVPFIGCSRCSKVWLVIEVPGDTYDDAVVKLKGRLKSDDAFQKPRPLKVKKDK